MSYLQTIIEQIITLKQALALCTGAALTAAILAWKNGNVEEFLAYLMLGVVWDVVIAVLYLF